MKDPIFKYPTAVARFEFKDLGWAANGEFYVSDELERGEVLDKNDSEYPGSFEKYKADFIKKIQDEIVLLHAGDYGQIMAPTNYVAEFWTPDFILRLANILRRPHKRQSRSVMLDLYLRAAWNQYGLCNMTRNELAAHLNKFLKLSITPAAAWQMAYRLDLFTKRPSGPKHKKQPDGGL